MLVDKDKDCSLDKKMCDARRGRRVLGRCLKGLGVLLWGVLPAYADPLSINLQHQLDAIRSMSADFTQTTLAKKRRPLHATGRMVLSKPGRLLWQLNKPQEQMVLADGRHVWIYDRALEQVTVKKQRPGMGGVAGLFLTGYQRSVAQYFHIEERSNGKNNEFSLHAKSSKAGIQNVQLRFVGPQLVFLELVDQLGQKTEIHFDHIHMNQSVSPRVFQFRPPKGVDVIQQ